MKNIVFEVPTAAALRLTGCLLCLFFDPENGGSMFFRNVCKRLPDYMALHPRRLELFDMLRAANHQCR
jgi:hypothetical protein